MSILSQAYEKHPATQRDIGTGREEPYVSMHHGHGLSLAASRPARLSELAQLPKEMLAPALSAASRRSSPEHPIRATNPPAPVLQPSRSQAVEHTNGGAKSESPSNVQGWLMQYAREHVDHGASTAEQLQVELARKMRAAAAAARLLRKAASDPRGGAMGEEAARAAATVLARRTERLRMEAHSVASREEDRRAQLGALWDEGDSSL